MFAQAFRHITAPVDQWQLSALRDVVLCGLVAFVLLIVGVGQCIIFVVFLFLIALLCVCVWLLMLTPTVRAQVLDRMRDVMRAFWRKCMDESFGGDCEKQTLGGSKLTTNQPKYSGIKSWCRRKRGGGEAANDQTCVEASPPQDVANDSGATVHNHCNKAKVVTATGSVDDGKEFDIGVLSKEFTRLFELNQES